jgi:pyrimidine-nucleoside phosphorylase
VGNSLEVKEALDTLNGRGPQDLVQLSLHLAAHLVRLGGGAASLDEAMEKVSQLLASGAGLEAFQRMVQAQEGIIDFSRSDYGLPQANITVEVPSVQAGFLTELDALKIGRAVMRLGADANSWGTVSIMRWAWFYIKR